MTRNVLLLAVLGCGAPSSPAPAATPSVDVPRLDASAAPTKRAAPKLDATCAADGDREAVFVADDCCSQCESRIANKTRKREIEAFCAKEDNRAKCEPIACSWGFGKPRCEKGLCR